jgi:hypothetical protein
VTAHADHVVIGPSFLLATGVLLDPERLLSLALLLLLEEPGEVVLGVEVAIENGSVLGS